MYLFSADATISLRKFKTFSLLLCADAKIIIKKHFFCSHKVEKPAQKVAYLWQLGVFFFSAAPTAQYGPGLHFRFINYFIQPSLVASLVQTNKTGKNVVISIKYKSFEFLKLEQLSDIPR